MADRVHNLPAEQAELEAVLASGIFARAPSLAHILTYICQKYFDGEADSIKEYNIAVEALGRPADFDQKKDSIVRVEAHRLRKRLRQFYQNEGATHEVRIDLPPGAYAPRFTRASRDAAPAVTTPAADMPGSKPRMPQPLVAAGILLVAALIALGSWHWRTSAGKPSAPAPPAGAPPQGNISEVRILCGSKMSYSDREGRLWVPDRYYTGGTAMSTTAGDILGSQNPAIFSHWRDGTFAYRIPVKPGVYEVSLYFSEPRFGLGVEAVGNETSRLFDVSINGKPALTEMDILSEAGGGRTMLTRVFRDVEPDKDGLIVLEFNGRVGGALVNGIAVVPGIQGRLRPIRIAARNDAYTDSAGRLWSDDRAFSGGKLAVRIEGISNTPDPDLYRGERYGNFDYMISVPPDSTYTAVLHFAETWFGGTGKGGSGSRLFDIFCNGERLLQNFDVHLEAGGAFRAIQRTFRGLKPTPNGKLRFQFNPSRNYAFVNALEILDEGAGAAPRPNQPAPQTR